MAGGLDIVMAIGAVVSAAAAVAGTVMAATAPTPSMEGPEQEMEQQKNLQLDQVEEDRKARELQRAKEEAEKRRLARIKAARIAAGAGGAGVSGSVLDAPLASTQSSLEGELSYSEKFDQLQETQYQIQREQIELGYGMSLSSAQQEKEMYEARNQKDMFGLVAEGIGAVGSGIKAGTSLYNQINATPTGFGNTSIVNFQGGH